MEAVGIDAQHKCARHFFHVQSQHSPFNKGAQPAYPEPITSAKPAGRLVCKSPRLYYEQIWNEYDCAGIGRRIKEASHWRERPMAKNNDRHGCSSKSPGWRFLNSTQQKARDRGRCRFFHFTATII